MATVDTTPILALVHPKRPMTQAERARNYRLRKKAKVLSSPGSAPQFSATQNNAGSLLPEKPQRDGADTIVTPPVTRNRVTFASVTLTGCALALAATGVTMNGWFARSLGSSDIAGWLFLAIGVAADCAALALPSCAARFWHTRQRATALAGWLVWLATFLFAVTAGIGFASTNIADVTMARASRITPAIEMARAALNDAMSARDRECKGGVGRFCRDREAEVAGRRQALDAASVKVEQAADPQTESAMRIATWLSGGLLRPKADDFAMLRLVLLALLPQIGGVLLMIGRSK